MEVKESNILQHVFDIVCANVLKRLWGERLGDSVLERLPLVQGVILESWDRVPHGASCMEPASPSACVSASVCVSHE